MAVSDPIGQEVVYRVASTGTGIRVTRYDGRGLADGIMGKRILRYFYDDNAEEKATKYARKKARKIDAEAKVALLGERFEERHPPDE